MPARPRMLFLSGLFPLPVASGGQQRTMHLLRTFRNQFDVTLVTHAAQPGFEPHLPELESLCSRVVAVVPINKRGPRERLAYRCLFWMRRILWAESSDRFYNAISNVNRAIDDELARADFDVVFCMYWFWHERVFDAPALRVIDANDVQSERQEHLLARSTSLVERVLRPRLLRAYRARETATLRRADVVVAVTEKDRRIFEHMTAGQSHVVLTPTGIDTDYFTPQPVTPDPHEIVFFGALQNPMNRDAVRFLVDDVLPRIVARLPDARLTIVGSGPTQEMQDAARADPRIRLTGFVDDVRPHLARAGVVVCPLRFGYGIRGRILEVLSLGVPVVATPIAVEGMGLSEATGVLLADDAQGVAEATLRLLADPAARDALARRGRDFAVRKVSLAATYGRLAAELLDRVAKRPGAAPVERVP